jgi:predicted dehydrogenase
VENARSLGVRDIALVRSGRPGAVPNPWGYPELPSVDALLDRGVEAAIVCTPSSLHVAPARALLEAGIPVMVEKPVAHRRSDLETLRVAAERRRTPLVPAHNLRFHAAIDAAHDLLTQGAVGAVRTARFSVGQYLPEWRPGTDYRQSYSARSDLGGGVTLDLMHEIDLACWWCGPFTRLAAWVGHVSALEIQAEDVAEMLLERSAGGVVSIHLDYLHHPYARGWEVIGDAGTMRFDYVSNRLTLGTPGSPTVHEHPLPPFERNDMYVALLRHFLAVAAGAESPRVTLADAAAALNVALTARVASEQGRWLPPDHGDVR